MKHVSSTKGIQQYLKGQSRGPFDKSDEKRGREIDQHHETLQNPHEDIVRTKMVQMRSSPPFDGRALTPYVNERTRSDPPTPQELCYNPATTKPRERLMSRPHWYGKRRLKPSVKRLDQPNLSGEACKMPNLFFHLPGQAANIPNIDHLPGMAELSKLFPALALLIFALILTTSQIPKVLMNAYVKHEKACGYFLAGSTYMLMLASKDFITVT